MPKDVQRAGGEAVGLGELAKALGQPRGVERRPDLRAEDEVALLVDVPGECLLEQLGLAVPLEGRDRLRIERDRPS